MPPTLGTFSPNLTGEDKCWVNSGHRCEKVMSGTLFAAGRIENRAYHLLCRICWVGSGLRHCKGRVRHPFAESRSFTVGATVNKAVDSGSHCKRGIPPVVALWVAIHIGKPAISEDRSTIFGELRAGASRGPDRLQTCICFIPLKRPPRLSNLLA